MPEGSTALIKSLSGGLLRWQDLEDGPELPAEGRLEVVFKLGTTTAKMGPASLPQLSPPPPHHFTPLASPPACKLRLRQDSQNQDLFFFEPMDTISAAAAASPGVNSRFFVDPEGRQTAELQDWLRIAEDLHREGQPILPLFINGQVKNGKSYMLNEVLPAVANTYYCSGGSGQQHAGAVLSGPNFLRVNCLSCNRSSGNGGFLVDFLLKLKQSAADQQLSAAASTPVPSDRSAGAMVVAIQDFMRRLPRDRLNFLLIDEAESFYLVQRPWSDDCPPRGPTLDVDAVLHMRCAASSRNSCWTAPTGSPGLSQAAAWRRYGPTLLPPRPTVSP
ncbi:hypothetical protein Agub_g7391 [Astrephomene gubernaculifera]|uniref:Uncharacterized protein n=1 Tax=Astrephomene gubernaculifera TaxID=47775 RepID=A0AAD3DQ13_9CHLO|nr:hypothetical protein Agub_g7391 [Astrephomene gubernaculifera]